MPGFKTPQKNDGWHKVKRNKTKKKKDLNKRGESKEGGEMDAFLDKGQDIVPDTSPAQLPMQTESVPSLVDNQTPSPVTIVDSEILDSIPLPEEILSPQENEISPTEMPSDTSLVSPSTESEDKENIAEEPPKIVLKYNYKEDQWSPLNPEGKKQYDRDFLLHLQSQPMSMRKPSNLPNLDVIKDKATIQRLVEINRMPPMSIPLRVYNDPFIPSFASRGGAQRPPHPVLNRRSQQGRDKPKKVISFSNSLNQAVKLHEAENAWKPSHKAEPTPDEKAEIQELYRKVRGILNKLTPQKFSTLVEQVKNLDINTEEKLNGVIDLVFEKAIDEPNFSVPYANMCKQLALIKVPLSGQPGQLVNFRKILLTKCQREFEQDRCDELKREERMIAINSAETEEKRKELQLEFDEEEKKMRYRQLGNIRFIGELFKLNMLIEPIMHECIKKLLSQQDEESLECLCRLLKTIGKELDEKKSRESNSINPMDIYFNEMQRIVDERLTSARVRFMLQDVIDLKKNNWIPRRDENNPKTIDQIHKEAQREAHEQQQVLQNISFSKRATDDRDRRKSTRNIGQSEDGWTLSSKSNKGSYNMVDPTKLKLTKPDEVDSMRLGPCGRGPQAWGKGSSGGTKMTPESEVKSFTNNKFSALSSFDSSLSTNYESRRGSQRSAASSRESSRGRSNQLPSAIRKTTSSSKERENLIETVKGLIKSNTDQKTQEIAKSSELHINGNVSSSLALQGPDLSEEEIEKKTKPLIDEFLHNNDFEEAIKCVMELASPSTVSSFITAAINQVLERSNQSRYLLGQLLYSLLKKDIITQEQYNKGFNPVVELIHDIQVDIPLIWEYLGEILEPMIEDNKVPLSFLKDVLQPCIPSEIAGKIVSTVLHLAAKKKGNIKLGELWRESELQWSDFLGSNVNISEFITSQKLEYTTSSNIVQPNNELTTEEIKTQLNHLLMNNKEDCEEIFDWIDANIDANRLSEPSFIRALVTAVFENAIIGSGGICELDMTKLKRRMPLLLRYIDHNENLQLQALYAIQALMNQLSQPKGILRQIFDSLYDDDVISEEVFKQWEKSDDPAEQEGKGVALMSVSPFFTWLRESEMADDD